MKKVILSLTSFFVFFSITLCFAKSASAEAIDYKSYKKFVYTDYYVGGKNVSVINYKGKKKSVVIPSKIRGNKVKEVWGFKKAKKVKKIHIPKTVSYLRLSEMPALKKVTISKKNKKYKVKDNFILNKKGNKICSSFGTKEEVNIPNTISKIGDLAFLGGKMKTVVLGENVKKIGISAFEDCKKLSKVVLKHTKKLPSIGSTAFSNNKLGIRFDVKNEKIAEQLKKELYRTDADDFCIYVEGELFYTNIYKTQDIWYKIKKNKVSIRKIKTNKKVFTIPREIGGYPVTTIGVRACSAMQCEEIRIPDSVKVIDTFAFEKCKKMKKVVLGNNVRRIGLSAFANCTALKSLILPDSVTFLDDNVFEGCTALKSVTLSSNLTEIPSFGFSGCTALKRIVLPKNIEVIGYYSFSGCDSLVSVKIKNKNLWLEEGAFVECKSLKSINLPAKLETIPTSSFYYCSSLKELKIPKSVTKIEAGSFAFCEKLKKVRFSKNIEEIGYGAFCGCYSLEKFEIDKKNKYYSVSDGILYDKGKTTLVSYPTGKKDERFQSDNTLAIIEDSAFEYNRHLKEVVINAKEIGQYAFANMPNLTTFTWNNSGKILWGWAFLNDKKLKSVVLPDSLETIENYAFGRTAITTLKVPKELKYITEYSFRGTKITNFILGENTNFIIKNGQLCEK